MNELLSEEHARIVEDILIETLDVNRDQLKPEARLEDDLGADSLEIVEIIMLLEEKFDISIPDEKSETVKTVAQTFEAVSDLLQQKSRAHL
jgi:acyl carrier protein